MKKVVIAFACALLFVTTLSLSPVYAKEFQTDKLKLEISTDKSEYRINEEASVFVRVTNVSSEALQYVELQTASDDLLKTSGKAYISIESLLPGQSMDVCFHVKAFSGSKKLNVIEKIQALFYSIKDFKSLIFQHSIGWSFSELNNLSYDYGVVNTIKSIVFNQKKLNIEARASYTV